MAYQPAGYPPPDPAGYGYPPPPRKGVGITALILGIVSLITLVACGLGVIVAIAGVVVGIIGIVQNSGRGQAIAGVILSVITLLIAITAIVWLVIRVAPCSDQTRYPTKAEQDRCVQERLPFYTPTEGP